MKGSERIFPLWYGEKPGSGVDRLLVETASGLMGVIEDPVFRRWLLTETKKGHLDGLNEYRSFLKGETEGLCWLADDIFPTLAPFRWKEGPGVIIGLKRTPGSRGNILGVEIFWGEAIAFFAPMRQDVGDDSLARRWQRAGGLALESAKERHLLKSEASYGTMVLNRNRDPEHPFDCFVYRRFCSPEEMKKAVGSLGIMFLASAVENRFGGRGNGRKGEAPKW